MKTFASRVSLLVIAASLLHVAPAAAIPITWDIDSSASYVRLTIPDQSIDVDGTSATVRIRDAGSSGQWTDAGGRRAALDGTLTAQVSSGGYQFFSGDQNVYALEQTNLRPNPAAFDSGNTDASNPSGQYSSNSTAPAAFGGRLRSTVLLTTADAGYFAMRNVQFDLASDFISWWAPTIQATTSSFGIASAGFDFDWQSLAVIGQPFPDALGLPVSVENQTNTAAGSVVGLYPATLTLPLNVPFSFQVGDAILNGTMTGQIVAYAMVPEPSSVALLAIGVPLAGLAWRRRLIARRA